MSHFAHITNGIIDKVIVIEQEMLNTGGWGDPTEWIETSPDTYNSENKSGVPIRKNYAAVGGTYDKTKDAFIHPKPYGSWMLNPASCQWEAPKLPPAYCGDWITWNELGQTWETKNTITGNKMAVDTPVNPLTIT